MANNDSKCESCMFWVDRNIIGVCQRYPQHVNKHKVEWCGEYKSHFEEPKRKPGRPKKEASNA